MHQQFVNLPKARHAVAVAGVCLALAGAAGVASAEPNTTTPAPPTTTTAPPAPGKPGTVHPNVTAGDCESGGGIVVYNPDGTGTCIGGFYGGLEVF